MDKVIQRRTFGEGIIHLLDAYGSSEDMIFQDKKTYAKPIIQRWQQFSKEQPDLADIIKNQIFIHRLYATKINAMMSKINGKTEFKIKLLLCDIFEYIEQTMEAFFSVNDRSHAIKLYIYSKYKLRESYQIFLSDST
ncbi:hypothetical protein PVA44_07395 (plasmid) [Entomospira nematocerorum]|uniref:Uncharacterized protein n=1 Tax=Entomospira nematocerorum TaxID=2719987 RepID=A0A968KUX1_9SPIO|nr:hypothetical protein [Entomospira nematocera]NIZ47734.1 hypothetical protein [Entomospira nematocera]WDI34661.1 hypothetical protein PVA44_07395 [Entomospira nematocera]